MNFPALCKAPLERSWRTGCTLLEFGGEADHVHLLAEIHPALNSSTLINNLKTAFGRARNRFSDHLKPFYSKPYFWHRAYYVGSVGGATLETVRRYVESQGTRGKPRKAKRPLDPLLSFGPRRGMRGQAFIRKPCFRLLRKQHRREPGTGVIDRQYLSSRSNTGNQNPHS